MCLWHYVYWGNKYGRAATKVRGCPPEGVADHVTGFPPLGKSINTRGGKDMGIEIGETEIVRVTRWFMETVCA